MRCDRCFCLTVVVVVVVVLNACSLQKCIQPEHYSISAGSSLSTRFKCCSCLWPPFSLSRSPFRLEFPDGLGLPVPQLACLCAGVCLPVCGGHLRPHYNAREPPLLPGGQPVSSHRTQTLWKYHLNTFWHLGCINSFKNRKHAGTVLHTKRYSHTFPEYFE